MLPEINGRQLLDVLADLKEPARLTDIARHVANDLDMPEPKRQLLRTIKSALDAGVRYGYVEKNDYFYSVKDAEDDVPPGESDFDSDNSVDSLTRVKNSRSKESQTTKSQPDQRKQLATTVKAKNKPADVETMSSDCNDNRRGMQRRRAGEKRRRSRSRSNRSARKSSRRRR